MISGKVYHLLILKPASHCGNIELPGKYKWRGSPTAGDGKIYLMNHNGTVIVVSSDSGKILNTAVMGGTYDDNTRSSIAISGSNLFIRTNEDLYCMIKINALLIILFPIHHTRARAVPANLPPGAFVVQLFGGFLNDKLLMLRSITAQSFYLIFFAVLFSRLNQMRMTCWH